MQLPSTLPPSQMQVGFAPLPTQIQIGSMLEPNGMRLVALTFTTPQGVNTFFVQADAVDQLCQAMRASATGLEIAFSRFSAASATSCASAAAASSTSHRWPA